MITALKRGVNYIGALGGWQLAVFPHKLVNFKQIRSRLNNSEERSCFRIVWFLS